MNRQFSSIFHSCVGLLEAIHFPKKGATSGVSANIASAPEAAMLARGS